MNENRLQHDLIMTFGQKYPQYRMLLFEVNNDTYNAKHAAKRLSMGMVPGVSDLIFIIPEYGEVAGIELKAPGSRHGLDQIVKELTWGENLIQYGGYYLISSEVNDMMFFIESLMSGNCEKAIEIQNCMIRMVRKQIMDGKKSILF